MKTMLSVLASPGSLRCEYQPIFDLSHQPPAIHSWECLTRGPVGTNLEAPGVLFEYARRKRAETLVDRLCVVQCLSAAQALPERALLTLNVHASTLALDRHLPRFLHRTAAHFGVSLGRVTLEVVEHAPVWDGAAFLRCLAELRHLGVCIALDDVGLGYSNLRMFLECRPSWVKVDRYLVRGLDTDARRRAVLKSLQSLATACSALVVAEGIERQEEFEVVRDLGIQLAQGFLWCRPLPPSAVADYVARVGCGHSQPIPGSSPERVVTRCT